MPLRTFAGIYKYSDSPNKLHCLVMTEPVAVDSLSLKHPPPDDPPSTDNYFTYGSFVLLVDRLLEVVKFNVFVSGLSFRRQYIFWYIAMIRCLTLGVFNFICYTVLL